MRGNIIRLSLSFLFLSCSTLHAQQEATLFHRPDIQSSSLTNPAFFGDRRYRITLPSIAFNYANTGFSYRDLIRPVKGSDSVKLDMEDLIGGLRKKESLFLQLDVRYFQAGMRNGPHYFGISAADRTQVNLRYPKKLLELVWYGNERFIGETVEIGVEASALKYRELAMHYGYSTERFRFGLQAKYLQGLAAFDTPEHSLRLSTDTGDYSLTTESDYTIRTASLQGFGELLPPFRIADPDRGLAFDLGFDAELGSGFSVSGSVLDLGYIDWREGSRVHRSEGSYRFSGIDPQRFIEADSLSFDHYVDTLEEELGFRESDEAFRTPLVPKLYVGGRYRPDSMRTIGLSMFGVFLDGFRPAFTASYQHRFEDLLIEGFDLRPGVSYSYKNRSFRNFGLSLTASYGSVEFFLVGDNILSWFLPRAVIPLKRLHPVFPDPESDRSIAVPRHMQNHNLRAGITIALGAR